MSKQLTRRCLEPGCMEQCERWRQCPDKECGHDIAFCDAHGGEQRAEQLMVQHMVGGHAQDPDGGSWLG